MSNGIVRTLARKEPIVKAQPDRHTGLRGVAENLSRRLYDEATIELLTEALHRLVSLAYEADAAGFVNIDGVTGRLLIPAPMGKAGHKLWGLYPSERKTLGRILRVRQEAGDALFVYDRGRRAWCVNLAHYPTRRAALAYLQQHPIGLEEYRLAHKQAME
jgi:hypothetical protein